MRRFSARVIKEWVFDLCLELLYDAVPNVRLQVCGVGCGCKLTNTEGCLSLGAWAFGGRIQLASVQRTGPCDHQVCSCAQLSPVLCICADSTAAWDL